MTADDADVVIWGVTTAGRTFRPSDWADRLAGLTSAFGADQRLMYSPHVRPMTMGGRTMPDLVDVDREAIADPSLRGRLLGLALDFVGALPPK